jgi:hypothetical protein
MTLKDQTAIVGVGSTPYYRRGGSYPQTILELAVKAILLALEDAGLSVDDLDGFAYYSGGYDSALIGQLLGVPEVRFSPIGQSGPFVAEGNIRRPSRVDPGQHPWRQPVGGLHHRHDSREGGVEQLRGSAINQVEGAEVALVTGGPASLPVSSLILRR